MTPVVGSRGSGRSEQAWVAVDEVAAVATARRRAVALATAAGLDAEQVGHVEIVVTELATNVVLHGGGGDLVLHPRPGGLQVLAVDGGPGTRDLEALIGDGLSTAGTLGVGLGAVRRLATDLRLWSEPGRGVVVAAEFGAPHPEDPERRVGGLLRPLRGETACGDALAWRRTATGWLLLLADGLGHGPLAAEASARAVEILTAGASEAPGDLVTRMHRALAGTRGAAVAVSRIDLERRVLIHAAVGNIAGRVLGTGRARSLMTQPGIVGHKLPRVQETSCDLDEATLVVLHSDGLTEKWDGAALPPVTRHGAAVCAGALLRDAGTRRDDAGVLTLDVAR